MLELIAIDLDGTLLTNDKTYDRLRFQKIKKQLITNGTIVCIATGNSFHKVEDYFTREEQEDIYFATENGNNIIRDQQSIYVKAIDYDESIKISKYIDTLDGFYMVVSSDKGSYFIDRNPAATQEIKFFNKEITELNSWKELPKDINIFKLAIYSKHSLEDNKVLVKNITDHYNNIQAMTSADDWVDVIHIDGGKGSAVNFLEEKYQINLDNTMAFGDSLNDLSIMKTVNYSVAMKNADADLSNICKYQIGSNEDQSVLDVLEAYLKNGNLDELEKFRCQ